MIVVDVNAIAYLWIPGELTQHAERALATDPHWVSTVLWRSEFRSVLSGYLRRGLLDDSAVARCLQGAESQLNGHEYLIPSSLVMEKVVRSSCSAYDCEYVALADDLKATLVTSDKLILDQFPRLTKSLTEYS